MSSIRVDRQRVIGEVNPRIYGHFAEHLGACVYGGMWAPATTGDQRACEIRADVLELVKSLRPPTIRWPGGCFSEYYHWEDGLGPVSARPLRFDWFWKKPESNAVGTHEFMDYCARVGAEPVVAVNVRTGSPAEAAGWVRYCNDADGEFARRRAENGHPEPFGVRLWDIGNESWDFGVELSAQRFLEFDAAMKAADPTILTVATGSHHFDPAWNRPMLETAGERLDYLAVHQYDGWLNRDANAPAEHYYANVASAWSLAESARRSCELLEEMLPHRPEVGVAMDEWGIWTHNDWGLQHDYDLSDGLVAASVLNAFQRLCRRLTMANWAQLVNCLGLIQATPTAAWETPVATVFRLYTPLCREIAVECAVECDTFEVDAQLRPGIPSLPYLDVSATTNADGDGLTLCVVNRHRDDSVTCALHIAPPPAGPCTLHELNGDHWFALNDAATQRTTVAERRLAEWPASYVFPAHSVTIIRG